MDLDGRVGANYFVVIRAQDEKKSGMQSRRLFGPDGSSQQFAGGIVDLIGFFGAPG